MMQKIVVIGGPTASGKTALSIALAKRFPFEIISADSMQIYRGMNIATAKPTEEEKAGIPHYLMDIIDPDEPFSVADYVRMAEKAITNISSRNKLPLVCGGTGFYIKALLEGIDQSGSFRDDSLREKLEEFAEQNGNRALWAQLNQLDPERAIQIHPNNRIRVIRSLELISITGKKSSELSLFQKENRYDVLYFTLEYPDRTVLYDRIDRRVDQMIENGLEEEVAHFFSLNLSSKMTAYQAIGYKEFREASSRSEAIEMIKLRSRQYAKRQITWFHSVTPKVCLNMSFGTAVSVKSAEREIASFLKR